MTDTQLLTLALAVIIPLSLLLYSNSRISEAKDTLKAEIAVMRAEMREALAEIRGELSTMRAEMQAFRTEVRADVQALEHKLVLHELEHHRKG